MPSRVALLLLVAAGLLAGCSSSLSQPTAATSTTSPPVTTAPTTAVTAPPTPPTTVYAPTAPQPSPYQAAGALVYEWSVGNRAGAATMAAPAAVATLFAQPYPAGWFQARGCTASSTNPGTCTYANRYNGSLYEIGVTHLPAGWYVSSVTVET